MQREFTEVLIAVRICPAQSRCPASLSCLYGCRYSCHCHFYFPAPSSVPGTQRVRCLINAKTESRSDETLFRVTEGTVSRPPEESLNTGSCD